MNGKRFEVVEKQGKLEVFQVIRDNQTGVLYMSHSAGYGLGLTALVDQEGKPLLDDEYIESKL
ncbi:MULTISPECIES: DUF6440 family protein [Sporosarcina]|uniref:DUF6440 family protein n=1 Tax=Sporosarcina TaxID=1569 RepID=UPI00129A724D|nr:MULTISPECIES: DUF6440 family protein [Sporosarcina]GKV65315.1 hypothetical protein NCCP2331_14680 [Sporosarcina sp. NCCP-2331]GLB55439.1 hypothetical protein NCCP2378_12260 [Sporosarcina sp. NCCP-2378]